MSDIKVADSTARTTRGAAAALSLVVTILVGIIGSLYAPRGFDSGFVDMGHDGYVLKVASDICSGSTLFKDVFTQYGIAGDHLNCLILKVNDSLLSLKYFYVFIYALAIGMLCFFTARWSSRRWALWISAFAIASAPFYRHGIMLSVQVLMLPVQVGTVAAALYFSRRLRPGWAALVGALSGIVFLLKQNAGLYQLTLVFLALTLIQWTGASRVSIGQGVRTLVNLTAAFAGVVLVGVIFVAANGALVDWWAQTVEFPRSFYTGYMIQEYGFAAQDALSQRYPNIAASLPWPVWVVWEAFSSQFWWMLLRAVLIGIAIVGLGGSRTRRPSILLLAFALAGLLINFPSYNFMHQWWSIIPWLCLVPLTIRAWAPHFYVTVVGEPAKSSQASSEMISAAAPYRVRLKPLLLESRTAGVLALAYFLAVIAALGAILSTGMARFDGGNFAALSRFELTCNQLDLNSRIDGICTTLSVKRNFSEVLSQLNAARDKYSRDGQNRAAVLSIEETDGIQRIAKSLLPLAALEGNHPSAPATWQLPVLRDLYPQTLRGPEGRQSILLRYGETEWTGNLPEHFLLAQIPDDINNGMAWSIYAPRNPPRSQNG